MTHRIWIGLALASGLALGCGGTHESAWETTPPTTSQQNQTPEARSRRETLVQEAEAAWAQRGEEAQLTAAIQKWEAAIAIQADAELYAKLSRAYYFLADGHMSFDEARRDAMMETFQKGTQAAERGLVVLSPDFGERMRSGTRIEEAVSILERSAVPLLYWRSANLGKWAAADGFATLLSYKDEIRAIMTRCLELDANYFYAAPHRYFGAFYARAPAFAGGDLDKSREHFEASLRVAPEYFATRVLFASDYAVKAQNRQLFEQQLNTVINGNPDALPDVAPENRVEQRKARELLAKADELFE